MAAQTQEELNNLVDQIIIDNTTNQVTPAKVRSVLKAIISSIATADAASVSATAPLVYDPFTNIFSITQADAIHAGYIGPTDFKRIRVVPFGKTIIFGGPEKSDDSTELEMDDVAAFIYESGGVLYFFIGAYNGGDPDAIVDGLPANWTLILANPYKTP